MKVRRQSLFVDTHTAGEPTRIILDGFPRPKGVTMEEKRRWLAENADWLRLLALREPRGHRETFGAIVTNPVEPDSQAGVVFMDGGGYLRMCGHGTIGVATALMSLGVSGGPDLLLDTPAVVVSCCIRGSRSRVGAVTAKNVPSFYVGDAKVFGTIAISLAFGGSLFGLIDAQAASRAMRKLSCQGIAQLGLRLLTELNKLGPWYHPANNQPMYFELIEFYEEQGIHRNAVVFGRGQVDRSPCGTGTCAKMALLHARGHLAVGEQYRNQSILGSEFVGRIASETMLGSTRAIIPEITGTAYVTCRGILILQEDDPFPQGFELPPDPTLQLLRSWKVR